MLRVHQKKKLENVAVASDTNPAIASKVASSSPLNSKNNSAAVGIISADGSSSSSSTPQKLPAASNEAQVQEVTMFALDHLLDDAGECNSCLFRIHKGLRLNLSADSTVFRADFRVFC